MAVKTLTVRDAARQLEVRPEAVASLLARGELTRATINDRLAVEDDAAFRALKLKLKRAARRVAA